MGMMFCWLMGTGLALSGPEPAASANKLVTVTYPVADLICADYDEAGQLFPWQGGSHNKTNEDRLIQLLMKKVAPETWASVGGTGVIQYFPLGMALVINQTREVHEQIQKVLAALYKRVELINLVKRCYMLMQKGKLREALLVARKADKLDADQVVSAGAIHIPTKCIEELLRLAIEEKLCAPVTLNFKDAPLRQVIADLHMLSGIDIVPDEHELQNASISMDQPLLLAVENVSLRSALNLLLKQIHLIYVVKDGSLFIMVPPGGHTLPEREYPLADWMVPGSHELIGFITSTVAADSWNCGWGPTISYCHETKSLVVCHTQDVQEEIAALLEALKQHGTQSSGKCYPTLEPKIPRF